MKKREIVLQIFTGGYLSKETSFEKIEKKIRPILETVYVSKVIAGWCIDEELYKKLRELVHSFNAELYLWLPVFSETGLLEPVSQLRDFEGNEVKSYQLKEGENFEFYCPNVQQNKDSIKKIYQQSFSQIGFDGIFLDKIRYASFSNGISGVFSCFCPKCMERYQEKQLDVEELRVEMKKVMQGKEVYGERPFGIISYDNGHYQFENPIWDQYFSCKASFVFEAIDELSQHFRGQGLKIGMDVFAPFLSYYVGQDLEKLKELADFMKPMMYRVTNAPAGLLLEYDSLLLASAPADQKHKKEDFNRILGVQSINEKRFNLDFVKSELSYMEKLGISVYCGIEVNRIEDIAPVYPEYIEETMNELIQTGIRGYVLSWDILSAPEENIEAVYRCLRNRSDAE